MSGPGESHPEPRYEQTDVRPGAIVRFGAGLVIVVALVSVVLLGLFALFARQQRRQDPPPPPLAPQAGRMPPEPRLQTTPLQDLERVRAQENKDLASYGWVDQKAGIVRIPVDEAIRILAARGLPPAAPSSPSPSAPPTAAPGGGRR